ncbi:MAG: hypothetical protein PVH46_07635 [Granulosicoccaceae bacterium]|jgi:hypothetical protein
MGEIVQFRKKTAKDKHRGNTLCRHGFHKWAIVHNKQFDVKLGKLVTVYRCKRCGAERSEAR